MAHDIGAHETGTRHAAAGAGDMASPMPSPEPSPETATRSTSEPPATLQLNALTGHVAELARARAPLADRIVALPPMRLMEAFRTKVKLKATTTPVAVATDDGTARPALVHDDLSRIRGITGTLAGRLAAVGVTRFTQIAAWEQPDVQLISQTLDLGRTISRQNWIEQAAVLAGPRVQLMHPPAQARVSASVPGAPEIPSVIREQLPPQIPVPEVPATFAPSVAAPEAATPPQLMLPRVVPVDASGDAKFHHVIVHVTAGDARDTAPPAMDMLPPIIPVPVVTEVAAAEVPAPAFQTTGLAIAEAAAAAAAIAVFVTPFEVPVPVVPEQDLPDALGLSTGPEAMAPAWPTLPPALLVEQPIVDDTLATQLQATVAAVADDRAVAATIDLLSAFSPPPVADDAGFPDAHQWPPHIPAVTTGARQLPSDHEAEADIAFTRWVPTTLVTTPMPPQRGGAADTWSPMPWSRAGLQAHMQMRAATTAAIDVRAFAAVEPHVQPLATRRAVADAVPASASAMPPPIPAVWTRPRDRWDADQAGPIVQPDQVDPPTEPALPETRPMVPLEPVVPSMLDRLASLEAELSALAANDQPRAHAATPSVPMSAYRVSTPLPMAPPPPVPRRAGTCSAAANVSPLPAPVGRAILDRGEADVMIVARPSDPLEIRSIAAGPSVGTLEQRMRRARPTPEVDVDTYAGYHGAIGEASVEIVRRDSQTRAMVFDDSSDAADDSNSRSREGTVRKFIKALRGDAN